MFRSTLPALAISLCGMIPALNAAAPPPEPGRLSVHEENQVVTVQFGGQPGPVGIPSWRIVVSRDEGGNLSSLHVPADHPASLSAREGQWPVAVIATSNNAGVAGTMTRGRENFAAFPAERFEVTDRTPEKVTVVIGGVSKNKHYEHERTYTFMPAGVKIEGVVRALIDLEKVGLWTHWDRRQIADSHIASVPVRTQGREGWVYMHSTGIDRAHPLPQDVPGFTAAFPLEVELKLARPSPTYLKLLLDRNFESAPKRMLVHNDKDVSLPNGGRRYGKIISMTSTAVPKGGQQTFRVRFEFETRE